MFLQRHQFIPQMLVDKIHGCMIGSALGDAIGPYTEFLSKKQCERAYPDKEFSLVEPVTALHPDKHRKPFEICAWTDDTDHAILILLSFLHVQTSTHDIGLTEELALRLNLWRTEGLTVLDRPPLSLSKLISGILRDNKYLNDPVGAATRHWVKSKRDVAPNGSLMRTHPIGVIGVGMTEKETWEISAEVGRITHVDPRCVVSCCISVGVIRGLIRGEIQTENDLERAIEHAYCWVISQPDIMNLDGLKLTRFETMRYLDRNELSEHMHATSLANLKLDDTKTMGYVYKCLGSAILLLRFAMRLTSKAAANGILQKRKSFEDLMVALIMEGGDADTNGAAAGALLGACLGYAHLPARWALGLQHKEWFAEKIDRMITAVGVVKGELEAERDEEADGGKEEDGEDDEGNQSGEEEEGDDGDDGDNGDNGDEGDEGEGDEGDEGNQVAIDRQDGEEGIQNAHTEEQSDEELSEELSEELESDGDEVDGGENERDSANIEEITITEVVHKGKKRKAEEEQQDCARNKKLRGRWGGKEVEQPPIPVLKGVKKSKKTKELDNVAVTKSTTKGKKPGRGWR